MSQPTFDHDTHLIAIAQGDHHAFIKLYRHEAPRMLTLATRMLGRASDAQDTVRDTFVLIWKHAESFDTTMMSARAWMYSIFRHRAMRTLRDPGRMAPAAGNWTDHLPSKPPEEIYANPVYSALQQLDGSQRRPLLMAYYHGYTSRQIAAKLGTTAEQTERQIKQALYSLRKVSPP